MCRFRSRKWLSYLLPSKDEELKVLQESGVAGVGEPSSPQTMNTLRHLLDETADLIDSPTFTYVLTLLNNEGFATLIEQRVATEAFQPLPPSSPSAHLREPEAEPQSFSSFATVVPPVSSDATDRRRTKLANVLAVITRQAHAIGNGNGTGTSTKPPNDYLVAMEQGVRELEAFAAVVYSSNFDIEIPGTGEGISLLTSTAQAQQLQHPHRAAGPTGTGGPSTGYVDSVDGEEEDEGGARDRENNATSFVELSQSSMDQSAEGRFDGSFEQAWDQAVGNPGPGDS